MKRPAPLTRDGRQTLVYLVFAGAGPSLTAVVVWAMVRALEHTALFDTFSKLSFIVAASLFVIVTGLAMFVSIRAVKISKDGFEASGGEGQAAQAVADSAQQTADVIKEATP